MAYDRQAALAYARAFWNRPADDGYGARFVHDFDDGFALGTEHLLLPDGRRWEWSALDDCTHFMSCCLGAPAGGLELPSELGEPYGIVGADRLVRHLVRANLVEVIP